MLVWIQDEQKSRRFFLRSISLQFFQPPNFRTALFRLKIIQTFDYFYF